MTLKLFGVYLGGRAEGSSIELHDVVFVVANTLSEAYPRIGQKWFGDRGKVHIDSYIELSLVDGYEIRLAKTTKNVNADGLKLFFLNFGAYEPALFGELHQCAFYVSRNKAEAIARAQQQLALGPIQPHLDDAIAVDELVSSGTVFDVDDVIEITEVDGYELIFRPEPSKAAPQAIPGYIKISHLVPL